MHTHTPPAATLPKVTLSTYCGQVAPFYIQSKGLHAGRPMVDPIPNSFAVYTDAPHAYDVAFAAWVAGAYKPAIIGTCIPFIRKDAAGPILAAWLGKVDATTAPKLKTIGLLCDLLANLEARRAKVEQLRSMLALSL